MLTVVTYIVWYSDWWHWM